MTAELQFATGTMLLAGASTLQARRAHGAEGAPPADEEAQASLAAAAAANVEVYAPPPQHGALARAPSLKDVHGREGFHAPRGRQLSFSFPLLQARHRPARTPSSGARCAQCGLRSGRGLRSAQPRARRVRAPRVRGRRAGKHAARSPVAARAQCGTRRHVAR
jgi:hypothetical protein